MSSSELATLSSSFHFEEEEEPGNVNEATPAMEPSSEELATLSASYILSSSSSSQIMSKNQAAVGATATSSHQDQPAVTIPVVEPASEELATLSDSGVFSSQIVVGNVSTTPSAFEVPSSSEELVTLSSSDILSSQIVVSSNQGSVIGATATTNASELATLSSAEPSASSELATLSASSNILSSLKIVTSNSEKIGASNQAGTPAAPSSEELATLSSSSNNQSISSHIVKEAAAGNDQQLVLGKHIPTQEKVQLKLIRRPKTIRKKRPPTENINHEQSTSNSGQGPAAKPATAQPATAPIVTRETPTYEELLLSKQVQQDPVLVPEQPRSSGSTKTKPAIIVREEKPTYENLLQSKRQQQHPIPSSDIKQKVKTTTKQSVRPKTYDELLESKQRQARPLPIVSHAAPSVKESTSYKSKQTRPVTGSRQQSASSGSSTNTKQKSQTRSAATGARSSPVPSKRNNHSRPAISAAGNSATKKPSTYDKLLENKRLQQGPIDHSSADSRTTTTSHTTKHRGSDKQGKKNVRGGDSSSRPPTYDELLESKQLQGSPLPIAVLESDSTSSVSRQQEKTTHADAERRRLQTRPIGTTSSKPSSSPSTYNELLESKLQQSGPLAVAEAATDDDTGPKKQSSARDNKSCGKQIHAKSTTVTSGAVVGAPSAGQGSPSTYNELLESKLQQDRPVAVGEEAATDSVSMLEPSSGSQQPFSPDAYNVLLESKLQQNSPLPLSSFLSAPMSGSGTKASTKKISDSPSAIETEVKVTTSLSIIPQYDNLIESKRLQNNPVPEAARNKQTKTGPNQTQVAAEDPGAKISAVADDNDQDDAYRKKTSLLYGSTTTPTTESTKSIVVEEDEEISSHQPEESSLSLMELQLQQEVASQAEAVAVPITQQQLSNSSDGAAAVAPPTTVPQFPGSSPAVSSLGMPLDSSQNNNNLTLLVQQRSTLLDSSNPDLPVAPATSVVVVAPRGSAGKVYDASGRLRRCDYLRTKVQRYACYGIMLLLLIALAVGIGVGVSVSQRNAAAAAGTVARVGPTLPPTPWKPVCIASLEELQKAVDVYLRIGVEQGGDVHAASTVQKYGSPIGSWCLTDDLTSLDRVFDAERQPLAVSFNEPLTPGWNTSAIRSMYATFRGARAFNQSLVGWDISNTTNFTDCFHGAASFQQDLCDWNPKLDPSASVERMFVDTSCPSQGHPRLDLSFSPNVSPFFCAPCLAEYPKCFDSNSELRQAADQLMLTEGDYENSEAALRYGFPVSKWCVGQLEDFSGIFAPYRNQNLSRFNLDLSGWDMSNAKTLAAMFAGSNDYPSSFNQPLEAWNVSQVTDMAFLFSSAEDFKQELNVWDVSRVRNMSYLFYKAAQFSPASLQSWDVSQVEDLAFTFAFNQRFTGFGLSGWDISKVTSLRMTFYGCDEFNEPLNSWNVERVTTLDRTFKYAKAFNQPLHRWKVDGVTDMTQTFYAAIAFNQPLLSWNVHRVQTMEGMFGMTESFDQPLESWNVSAITNMKELFEYSVFNQPLNNWDVSRVTDMEAMFEWTEWFNQPLNNWDMSKVSSIKKMFYAAVRFNQDLSAWFGTAGVDYQIESMQGAFLLTEQFSQNLCSWGPTLAVLGTKIGLRKVFGKSACLDDSEPDLTSTPPGPFCVPC